jgi:hypothetical protein
MSMLKDIFSQNTEIIKKLKQMCLPIQLQANFIEELSNKQFVEQIYLKD